MGPWTHMGMRDDATYTGDVDFGPESVWGLDYYFESMARFFDRWLKDESTGVDDEPPVRLFVMGGGS
ncbi:MAG TPA: antibiotic hydrolase, partial [Candidatus Latescibacteria bacterium]|nr:antibiotic hydrolase [Candidatus Latescibacterota bacterium]